VSALDPRTLSEMRLERERLAVDKLDAVGFLALQEEGCTIARD
jgi:hypothetical protein